jgi:hypothetical protein
MAIFSFTAQGKLTLLNPECLDYYQNLKELQE